MQPTIPMTLLPETPVNPVAVSSSSSASLFARSILPDNSSHTVTDTSNSNSPVLILSQDRQVEVFMPCTRQHDRFVDPESKPLQLGTVIFCEELPFMISNNGKIIKLYGGQHETVVYS